MHNHLYHILTLWHPLRAQARWVAAAVVATHGSVYRKAGALMLLSDQGHRLGLVSGGCLEADLQLQALRVVQTGKSLKVRYDSGDAGGLAWRLGIGCGGAAEILLHPCSAANDYLGLVELHRCLNKRLPCSYHFNTATPAGKVVPAATLPSEDVLAIAVEPPTHLLIFGAGADMQPMVDLAARLGWRVTLVDKRPANARAGQFPAAEALHACSPPDLPESLRGQVDAAVVATHNLAMDAAALTWLQGSGARYVGLLGPRTRREQVLALAGLRENDLTHPLAGPMGLDLGGDLPEAIALSTLAECQAVLHGRSADSLSSVLPTGTHL